MEINVFGEKFFFFKIKPSLFIEKNFFKCEVSALLKMVPVF